MSRNLSRLRESRDYNPLTFVTKDFQAALVLGRHDTLPKAFSVANKRRINKILTK
ncbi:hypothetical protein AAMO2058_001204500 [Amorphochlora amoebiformis]